MQKRKRVVHEKQVYQLLEEIELAFSCAECGLLSLAVLGGEPCPHCFIGTHNHQMSLAPWPSTRHSSGEFIGGHAMQEITVQLQPAVAQALAQFLKRLDHDALVRYAHPADHSNTEKALGALRQALKDAGQDPR